MDEKNIIKFKQNRVRSEPTVHKEAFPNVVYTYPEYPYPQSFCFSRVYSLRNKLDISTEGVRDLVLRAMRDQEMKTIDARLTYVLIRNRFDPKDILEPNAKILGYVIEGKYCNIYYNRSTRDIEIRIPRGVVGVDDRYINITRKISRVIDRAVRNEISRIEFLELLRSRSQD